MVDDSSQTPAFARKATALDDEQRHAGPQRVLVVDDEIVNRTLLCTLLRRQGFETLEASSGPEAIRLAFSQPIDLILLDLVMPDSDGFQVLAQLRAKFDETTLPVVIVTATEETEQIVRAFQCGANDYVTKPIDADVMLARVMTQLRLRHAQSALRESEERYAIAARGANDGLWDWNLTTGDVYYSPRWLEMLGLSGASSTAKPEQWFTRVHPEDRQRVRQELDAHCAGHSEHFETELRMLHEDGGFRWMLCRGLAVRDAKGNAVRVAGSLTDITEGKVADALTGLPNRLFFLDRLQRAIRRLGSDEAQSGFAVIYLDVDNFKLINDSLGHSFGDELLMAVAHRIERCIRSSESLVARLGGDEFAILIESLPNTAAVEAIAVRIIEAISRPFAFHGREVFTSTSIGIAVCSDASSNAEDVLREADTAMYQAKSLGKNAYEVFDPDMKEQVTRRLEMEHDLRRALERNELRLYYQPIVRLQGNRIDAFEALVRWEHPQHGMISPEQFIPLAEETGLIVPLGSWVLHEACRQLAEWQQRGWHDLRVSVNVSSKQLTNRDFIDEVAHALHTFQVPAATLKLEITESAIMENPETGVEILRELRELGVRIGIDDFGTGYSSLASLHRLPLDVLKVDRSFVSKMVDSQENTAIVRTIMALAESLNLSVIAEGIETPEQHGTLGAMGCEYGQGYLFARPLPSDEVDLLLDIVQPA
ncbi:MAG: EAL domain-containing protein [Planctomycetales bacterium]|nr:EAL domain-containing protein [Planctomycetales bacterium]